MHPLTFLPTAIFCHSFKTEPPFFGGSSCPSHKFP